jgi:hypothetical protein
MTVVPLSPRMPNLTSLQTLLTLARTGDVAASAEAEGVTRQCVSARLKSERSLRGSLRSLLAHGPRWNGPPVSTSCSAAPRVRS